MRLEANQTLERAREVRKSCCSISVSFFSDTLVPWDMLRRAIQRGRRRTVMLATRSLSFPMFLRARDVSLARLRLSFEDTPFVPEDGLRATIARAFRFSSRWMLLQQMHGGTACACRRR